MGFRHFLFATPIGHPSQLILLLMMSIILPIYRFSLSLCISYVGSSSSSSSNNGNNNSAVCCLAIVWQFLASKQSVIESKKLFLFSDWRQTELFFSVFVSFVAAEWEAIMTTDCVWLKLCVLANYYYCHYGGRLGSQRRMQNTVIVIIDVVKLSENIIGRELEQTRKQNFMCVD